MPALQSRINQSNSTPQLYHTANSPVQAGNHDNHQQGQIRQEEAGEHGTDLGDKEEPDHGDGHEHERVGVLVAHQQTDHTPRTVLHEQLK